MKRPSALQIISTTAAIAAIPVGVLALITLGQLGMGSLQDELVADVEYGSFALPPSFSQQLASMRRFADYGVLDSITASLLSETSTREEQFLRRAILLRLSDSLESQARASLPLSIALLSGYWELTITNESDRKLAGVSLTVPHGRDALLLRVGTESERILFEDLLRLGDLAPKEVLRVMVWTTMRPAPYDHKALSLVHDDGVADLHFRTPVGALGQFVDKYIANTFFLILLTFTLLWAWLSLQVVGRTPSPDNREKLEPPDPDAPPAAA